MFLLTKALINSFILSIIYENKYRIIPYHYPLKSKLFPCHEQIIYIFVGITNYISFKSQNMKKLSFIITFVFLSILFVQAQQAKYVFYFIGDGMGVNQVLGTEMYRSELKGEIGITPLLFTQFPFATVATTFSATNGVTDSAAAGTALATGNKTKNGTLGMKKDLETKINSVAAWAKDKGCRVGISTSVSVDHATPAAFYAHQAQRSSYYNVGLDLIKANYDFYAGSDFLDPTNKKEAMEARKVYIPW